MLLLLLRTEANLDVMAAAMKISHGNGRIYFQLINNSINKQNNLQPKSKYNFKKQNEFCIHFDYVFFASNSPFFVKCQKCRYIKIWIFVY